MHTRPAIVILLLAAGWGCQPSQSAASKSSLASNPPPRLVSGLGPVHHPVSTVVPDAQKFFDQGLAYMYAFNHAEAERSFARAGELDPKLAMAQWGRALALGPNINLPEIDADAAKAAYDAGQRAMALAPNATAAERAYIAAVVKRYPADPKGDWHQCAVDYKNAMGEVMRHHPDDLDAATLYAESAMDLRPWRLYTQEGKPEEGTEEIVAVLEWVLARNPNHVGANHYYIHAVEASTAPQRALPSAQRLPRLAPSAGHLVHMPAHIYIRLGDYDNAIRANEEAAKVDERYIACCAPKMPGGGLYPAMYYSHNLHFLAFAAAMAGRSKEASDAAATLAAHAEPGIAQMPMLDAFASIPILIAARQAQWGEILKWPRPAEGRDASLAAWHLARGLAHASTKDVGPALEEQEALAAAIAKIKDLSMGNNTAGAVMAIGAHLLAGKIAAARGDGATARRELEAAVAAQDALVYDEPPAFPWPAREALGAHLLRSGDPAAAEKVFREDLVKMPNNPRSLLGLAESLAARGKPTEAEQVRKEFAARSAGADMKLRVEDF